VRPRHPEIERVMQEQVRQNRADNTTLRGATLSLSIRPVFVFHASWSPANSMARRPVEARAGLGSSEKSSS